ncbi:hypothetical protein [Infirmifilum sp. NZ]|uniref:hypothetical protein n=1 Tax=Infirmifilum sp. NZ TaxID=2926850 RepID=UPI0027A5970B|nr:hypothetical protein [Infirmifilum sp. NZ]UNQ72802.1 hypothetical protein MOV14_06710 [Infirmifilum sp. NZ]
MALGLPYPAAPWQPAPCPRGWTGRYRNEGAAGLGVARREGRAERPRAWDRARRVDRGGESQAVRLCSRPLVLIDALSAVDANPRRAQPQLTATRSSATASRLTGCEISTPLRSAPVGAGLCCGSPAPHASGRGGGWGPRLEAQPLQGWRGEEYE